MNAPATAGIPGSRPEHALHPRNHRGRRPHRQIRRPGRHALPARAQRLSPHRPCQGHLPRFRHGAGKQRRMPPAHGRHQSRQGRRRIHRFHQGRCPLARVRLGTALLPRLRLLRADGRARLRPHPRRQGLCLRTDRRTVEGIPRHPHRARQGIARSATVRPKRISTCSPACAPASSPMAPRCSAPRSTWPRPTSTCAIRSSTASSTPRIPMPATSGASIPCTTTPTPSRTRSKRSPIRCAPSSSRCTAPSTTGSSRTAASSPPSRWNSRACP